MSEENKTKTFEEAMTRLEEIVRALEGGNVPLDESLVLFEEGISLVRFCNSRLEAAEQKVRLLTVAQDGTVGESDFETKQS